MPRDPILCATDLTPGGARAVELAASAAHALGRSVHLVHAIDRGPEVPDDVPPAIEHAARTLQRRIEERVETARSALADERARIRSLGVEADVAMLDGHPHEAILAEAQRVGASMIVLGPHRSGELAAGVVHAPWARTAPSILRSAACPVLVATHDGPVPGIGRTRWIVALDLSPSSSPLLASALALASAAGSRVSAFHVVTHESRGATDHRAAEHALESAVLEASGGRDAGCDTSVVRGEPASAIAREIATDGAAMVVVGTHGRRGVARLVLGSVAERVVRLSPVPVLVIPIHVA